MRTNQILIGVVILLVLALLFSGVWGLGQKNQKEALKSETEQLSSELGDMESVKLQLEEEVSSLQNTYDLLVEENEALQGSLADAQKQLVRKDVAIRNANKKSSEMNTGLKGQIEELLSLRDSLQGSIVNLQEENLALKEKAGILEEDLNTAREENEALANLNRSMQAELNRLTLANFKASAFQVSVEQKNEKVTSKSRRARRINVTFDLTEVPEEYQAIRPLYLTVTDERGTPIKAANPIQKKITAGNQQIDLIAVEVKEVNIGRSQRLSFSHELDEKLASGFYRASVYTDIGLLGATSFRLR